MSDFRADRCRRADPLIHSARRHGDELADIARAYLTWLSELVERGGPETSDYRQLDRCFESIDRAISCGCISKESITLSLTQLGDAFNGNTMQGHGIRKPFGYAGDFLMIDRIYRTWLSPDPKLRKWDEYFQSRPACLAVRNRKDVFVHLVGSLAENRAPDDGRLRVLNLGCGPCRDVLEYLSEYAHRDVHFTCVDHDLEALNYARELLEEEIGNVDFVQGDVLKIEPGDEYDLVWSAGVMDYFPDRIAVVFLRKALRFLSDSGVLTVGNFSPKNPTRAYMNFGEWSLFHRSSDSLEKLALAAGAAEDTIHVTQEAQGINLFLHVARPRSG